METCIHVYLKTAVYETVCREPGAGPGAGVAAGSSGPAGPCP